MAHTMKTWLIEFVETRGINSESNKSTEADRGRYFTGCCG